MSTMKHFSINTAGRDFVVGDIHGCFDLLSDELKKLDFDPASDRLFSVGDLVDRGPYSAGAIHWLSYPWFHAVRGNHEQIVIDACTIGVDPIWYSTQGGDWFLELSEASRDRYGDAFAELPVAIEIETPAGLVGIVHAEVFGDWRSFCNKLVDDAGPITMHSIWGRKRLREGISEPIGGLAALFVGHCIVDCIGHLGNSIYIDTGAYKTGKLTVLNIADVLEQREAA